MGAQQTQPVPGHPQGLCEAPDRLCFPGRRAFWLLQFLINVFSPSCRGRCGRTGARPPLTRPTAGCRSSVSLQTTCTSWILARSAPTQPSSCLLPCHFEQHAAACTYADGTLLNACGQRWEPQPPHQPAHQTCKQCHSVHLQLMPKACAPGNWLPDNLIRLGKPALITRGLLQAFLSETLEGNKFEIKETLMPDSMHPSAVGMRIIATRLEPLVSQLVASAGDLPEASR